MGGGWAATFRALGLILVPVVWMRWVLGGARFIEAAKRLRAVGSVTQQLSGRWAPARRYTASPLRGTLRGVCGEGRGAAVCSSRSALLG